MAADIISRHARSLLANELANWNLQVIDDWFGDAGIEFKENLTAHGGERRKRVAGFYSTLDFSDRDDVRKFLAVAREIVLQVHRSYEGRLDLTGAEEDKEPPLSKFLEEMKRKGFDWLGGAFVPSSGSARLADTRSFADRTDLAHIGDHIARIERSIDSDAQQAIGSAKELIESVAKTILDKRGVTYSSETNLGQLGKETFKVLRHIPPDLLNESDAKQAGSFVQIMLSNLGNVITAVGGIRNIFGTGHGKGDARKRLDVRHAKLVVAAAAAVVWYWLETDADSP